MEKSRKSSFLAQTAINSSAPTTAYASTEESMLLKSRQDQLSQNHQSSQKNAFLAVENSKISLVYPNIFDGYIMEFILQKKRITQHLKNKSRKVIIRK